MGNILSSKHPAVSIVINTDGRAGQLAMCLESLRYLRYPNFEVVVVAGPTQDGTRELCASWSPQIKFAECGQRNLSRSRNIGIGISSGEIVAFLDDDSVPEPEWLDDIIPSFEDPEVGTAGGFVYNCTGKSYQSRFISIDRCGTDDYFGERPCPQYNFPGSFTFPRVAATSAFRRTAIIDVCGFDEEYEYFHDETDLICRLVDNGWVVAQLDRGFVHHRFMPSRIRNESKVLTSWYSVVKNRAYFGLQNSRDHMAVNEIVVRLGAFIDEFRRHVRWAVKERLLIDSDLLRFEEEVDRALREGLARGLSGQRHLPPVRSLTGNAADFLPFKPLFEATGQRCYVFLMRTYPPGSIDGIGSYLHQLARSLAAQGHQIHVLTAGEDHDRVDFEECVWVHRIVVREYEVPTLEGSGGASTPSRIWNYSRTMFAETEEIASRRSIDCVYAPSGESEGIAFRHNRRFPLATGQFVQSDGIRCEALINEDIRVAPR